MLARELERAGCVPSRSCSIASCGERLRPSQLCPRGGQHHAVRLLELAREPQVLIRFVVAFRAWRERPGYDMCGWTAYVQ